MDVLTTDFSARVLQLDDGLIAPYGGTLLQAFMSPHDPQLLVERITAMPRLPISSADLFDLELIASGALSPLGGFMSRASYDSVLARTALPDGRPWGLPVTLAISDAARRSIRAGQEVALCFGADLVAVMRADDIYPWDPEAEARALGGAADAHPRIRARRERHMAYLLGGPIALLDAQGAEPMRHGHLRPLEMRSHFAQHAWRQVAVPHVWSPWRRTHEYLIKSALEYSDALLLHDAVEEDTGRPSVTAELFAAASRMLIADYLPAGRVRSNPIPAGLTAHGTRAILQHAILSQNYGISRIYVPEEALAVEGQPDARAVLAEARRFGLEIRAKFMPRAFHCEPCGGVATSRSCPHDDAQRVMVSDDDIVERILQGESLPPFVTRPEIARALARSVADRVDRAIHVGARHIHPHASEVSNELRQTMAGHRAVALWMTGLSGSGKSTIAHRLERELLLAGHRVFVVDGDTLRHGLNRDLGFSEQDRRENLRRAAETVKVMVDAGLIVIASFISPFRAERQMVRDILGTSFHEVYVQASLEACEERDPKGLYKRARSGQIPQFTGISSPYEPPENPDLRLDTTHCSVEECVRQMHDYLSAAGLLRVTRHAVPQSGRPHLSPHGDFHFRQDR